MCVRYYSAYIYIYIYIYSSRVFGTTPHVYIYIYSRRVFGQTPHIYIYIYSRRVFDTTPLICIYSRHVFGTQIDRNMRMMVMQQSCGGHAAVMSPARDDSRARASKGDTTATYG